MKSKVLTPSTGERLLRKLAEPEAKLERRLTYTPRDQGPSLPGAAQEMYHCTGISTTTVRFRPGIWVRSGHLNGTRYAFDAAYTPTTNAQVSSPAGFTGTIGAYALLVRSDGYIAPEWAPTTLEYQDAGWESASWGEHGVELVFFENGVFTGYTPGVNWAYDGVSGWDTGKQLVLLAEIVYDSGEITDIIQVHEGPLFDSDPFGHGPINAGSTDPNLHAAIEYTSETVCSVSIENSVYRQSGYFGTTTVTGGSWASGDISGNTPAELYVTVATANTPGDAAVDRDPCLVTPSPTVLADPIDGYDASAWGGVYFQGHQLVGEIQQLRKVGNQELPQVTLTIYEHGPMWPYYMRPDGVNSGLTYVDVDPRIRGLSFNTSDVEHKGELQEYRAYEDIVAASNIGNNTGDKIISFYDYVSGGETVKKYARLDSHNAGTWLVGSSLEYYDTWKVAQLYGWDDGSPSSSISDATTEIGSTMFFLGRDSSGLPTLTYLDISSMKVADAYLADSATTISGTHAHENHVFTYDDHDGSGGGGSDIGAPGKYIEVTQGASRNNMSGVIGDSLGSDSIKPDDRQLVSDWSVNLGSFEVESSYAFKHAGQTGLGDLGALVAGHSGGILVDYDSFLVSVEAKVLDILGGYGLI